MVQYKIKIGNVLDEPSDLLLLKFAQSFYGADQAVAERLIAADICKESDLNPRPGESVILETNGVIAPKRVMFLGTPPLRSFNYAEMQRFARTAIERLADLQLSARSVSTTVHGTGYGLDGGEALQRLVAGFSEGLRKYESTRIQKITFLTLGERSERMLKASLETLREGSGEVPHKSVPAKPPRTRPDEEAEVEKQSAITFSGNNRKDSSETAAVVGKRRVFVALPFSEEFQNVYEYGIYPAARNCGYICERVDETHFTGDILMRIRAGIEAADVVVADVSEARPNVYLEVGYAWGKDIPVVFVAKKGEKLHFDVSTQKCIFYGKYSALVGELEKLLRGIQAA